MFENSIQPQIIRSGDVLRNVAVKSFHLNWIWKEESYFNSFVFQLKNGEVVKSENVSHKKGII